MICPLSPGPKRCSAKARSRRQDLLDRDASGVFSAYQAFMGNIQTVSTLLMGFIITGTLLSVMVTGAENYGAREIYAFTCSAVSSAVFSGLSLLLSFIVQARGTWTYENFGAVKAVKSMRRSTLCICVAEGCIYWSLIFFLWSLQEYIMMYYVGPDICPYTQEDRPSGEAFCSRLGQDFHGAMRRSCAGGGGRNAGGGAGAGGDGEEEGNVRSDFVCSQYQLLERSPRPLEPPLTPRDFAVWDCAAYGAAGAAGEHVVSDRDDCHGVEHLRLINDVSEALCSVPAMTTLRRRLCRGTVATSAGGDAGGGAGDVGGAGSGAQCAEAYTAYRKAMECVDQHLEDAKRCFQVCQWSHGQPQRTRLERNVRGSFRALSVALGVLFFVRFCRGLQQACHVAAADDAPCLQQLLLQLFVREAESSESSDEGDEDDGGRAALQHKQQLPRLHRSWPVVHSEHHKGFWLPGQPPPVMDHSTSAELVLVGRSKDSSPSLAHSTPKGWGDGP